MNDDDLDLELERRLRGWYRGEFGAGLRAPEPLRASVAAIPSTLPLVQRRIHRRGLTLLAAAAALVALGGVAASGFLAPAPTVFVIAPSPSAQPSRSASPDPSTPVPTSDPSVAPSDAPVVVIIPSPVPVDVSPVAATWRPAGTMATGRIAHTATLLLDGRVLVAGGLSVDRGALASAELWDPVTHGFSSTGSMHAQRVGGAAALLLDGRVFVVGGDDADSATASAEIWDPATGTFGPEMPTPLTTGSGVTATTLVDGRVLVVGGVKCVRNPPRPILSCGDGAATLIWDPRTSTFTPGAHLAQARDWGTSTLLLDGRVLLVGGTGEGIDTPESAEVWDPDRPVFELVGEPHDYRSGSLSATVLPDSRVLIVGGDTGDLTRNDAWFGPLGSAELWDPATGKFARAGEMATVRSGHQAGLLAGGQVIVVGGSAERSADFVDKGLKSTEIWDPADGSFRAGPSMEVGRRAFTLTRLLDGTYLAIGGSPKIDRGDLVADTATAEQLGSFPE